MYGYRYLYGCTFVYLCEDDLIDTHTYVYVYV